MYWLISTSIQIFHVQISQYPTYLKVNRPETIILSYVTPLPLCLV